MWSEYERGGFGLVLIGDELPLYPHQGRHQDASWCQGRAGLPRFRLQDLASAKAEQKWEEEGGRRREFLDLAVDLHELLDRRPCEVDGFYVYAMKPSDDQAQGDWVGAAAARRALVAPLQQQSG